MKLDDNRVTDHPESKRFELDISGKLSVIEYTVKKSANQIYLVHTEVHPDLQGKGVGQKLVKEALDMVRASGYELVPRCHFVVAYLKRHKEYHDLMSEKNRKRFEKKKMAEATVTPTGPNYRVKGVVRTHEVYLDEPTDKGGGDTAPGPTEMVCAALAACTTITLQMYIQRKGWAVVVESVKVVYETAEGSPTFQRQVVFHGANNEQLPRLTAIANACPVHKMLSTANNINSKIIN